MVRGSLEKKKSAKKIPIPDRSAEPRPFSQPALTQIIQAGPSLDAFVIGGAALPRKEHEERKQIWASMTTEKNRRTTKKGKKSLRLVSDKDKRQGELMSHGMHVMLAR